MVQLADLAKGVAHERVQSAEVGIQALGGAQLLDGGGWAACAP